MSDNRTFRVEYKDNIWFVCEPVADTTGWSGYRVSGSVKGMTIQIDIENAAPTRVFQVIDNLVQANL